MTSHNLHICICFRKTCNLFRIHIIYKLHNISQLFNLMVPKFIPGFHYFINGRSSDYLLIQSPNVSRYDPISLNEA